MSNFTDKPAILKNLLDIYDKIMYLKIFIDKTDKELINKYQNAINKHNNQLTNNDNIDAGFDLFAPNYLKFFGPGWEYENPVNELDFEICCSAKIILDSGKSFNTGYYLHPRSSLSKTQIRLANATGIIDAGYRGHLKGMFDVVNIGHKEIDNRQYADYIINKFDKYIQVCSPGLVPIYVELVNVKEELGLNTQRGVNGFGSTG